MSTSTFCASVLPLTKKEPTCGPSIMDMPRDSHVCIRKAYHSANCVCACSAEWGPNENRMVQQAFAGARKAALKRAAELIDLAEPAKL